LLRYDSLRSSNRREEAAKVLDAIRPVDPDSPYVLARFAEVLANDAKRKEQSVEALLRITFGEKEESNWPIEYAWKAVRGAGLEEAVYREACERLRKGDRPTLTALTILGSYVVERWTPGKRALQPYWRTWFKDRGAREVVQLLKMVDAANWPTERQRASLIKQLNDAGYARLTVKYWKKDKVEVESDAGTWAETARALVVLKRKREARKLLRDWRGRTGVGMWAVANYVYSVTGTASQQLQEVRAACRDALTGLPHDHCAKYLVHRETEACALLGDESGLLEAWKEYRSYFNGKLEQGEWFESRRRHLLGDLPELARSAQENNRKMYRKILRSLRWKRIVGSLQLENNPKIKANLRWWWVIWILFMLLGLLFQHR